LAYILDTNVAIHLRDGDEGVTGRIAALQGQILLSIVTRMELVNGIYRLPIDVEARRGRVDAILAAFPVLAFEEAECDAYASIVAEVGYSRRKLLDRMIAAQALTHRATLVTMNAADFRDVPGLDLLEW
jgi:predicted nucleic acid-binding protein